MIIREEKEKIDSEQEIKKTLDSLTIRQMLPEKFQPQFSNQFVCNFIGVKNDEEIVVPESFQVKYVKTFATIKKSFWSKKLIFDNVSYLPDICIVANLAVAPSISQAAVECLRNNTRMDISIKKLDPIGTSVEHRIYKKCELTSFNFGDLNYDDKSKVDEIAMYFKCKYFDLEY